MQVEIIFGEFAITFAARILIWVCVGCCGRLRFIVHLDGEHGRRQMKVTLSDQMIGIVDHQRRLRLGLVGTIFASKHSRSKIFVISFHYMRGNRSSVVVVIARHRSICTGSLRWLKSVLLKLLLLLEFLYLLLKRFYSSLVLLLHLIESILVDHVGGGIAFLRLLRIHVFGQWLRLARCIKLATVGKLLLLLWLASNVGHVGGGHCHSGTSGHIRPSLQDVLRCGLNRLRCGLNRLHCRLLWLLLLWRLLSSLLGSCSDRHLRHKVKILSIHHHHLEGKLACVCSNDVIREFSISEQSLETDHSQSRKMEYCRVNTCGEHQKLDECTMRNNCETTLADET